MGKDDRVGARSGIQSFEDAGTHAPYQARRDSGKAPNETMERHAFDALLAEVRGLDVLDLGCGDGGWARELLAGGCRSYRGLDASARMIELAERAVRGSVGRVQQGTMRGRPRGGWAAHVLGSR